ncbi:MAG: phospholipase D-like domain-containing protein, partial [Iamia sp.]
YDSFVTSVEEMVHRASRDPKTLAIKITLYRTSGDSPIVRSLVRAAERGKQVAALVELQARFDEANNIEWAKVLEEAGVHVTYGLLGLKTHTKTLLVVRDEDEGIRRYCHVGTGNYNSRTATLYEDLGVLSADPDLGADLTQLFNYLTGYGRNINYRRLMVAPHSLRRGIVDLIEGEVAAGPGRGRIVMKMNSLVDPQMIDQLYAASCAGVEIDLIVRGICCLRPGVPGLSERIRVRSLVGRYLEHSRIFWFANGTEDDQPLVTFGSADIMPRNLDRRVEALTVVTNPAIEAQVREVLDVNLSDDSLAWTLDADGSWQPIKGDGTVHAQERFRALALARTRRLEDAEAP